VSLSREHHFGLLFCWKLRQGLQNGSDLQVMRDYVRYFWDNVLKEHCYEEEWLLQRLLPDNNAMQIRIEEDHHLVHGIVHLICNRPRLTRDLFEALQQDLNDHIRWEERELFSYLQTTAQSDELELAGKLLEHRHPVHTDNFTPEFWVKRKTEV